MKILAELAVGFGGCAVILGVAFLAGHRWAKRLGVDQHRLPSQKGSQGL